MRYAKLAGDTTPRLICLSDGIPYESGHPSAAPHAPGPCPSSSAALPLSHSPPLSSPLPFRLSSFHSPSYTSPLTQVFLPAAARDSHTMIKHGQAQRQYRSNSRRTQPQYSSAGERWSFASQTLTPSLPPPFSTTAMSRYTKVLHLHTHMREHMCVCVCVFMYIELPKPRKTIRTSRPKLAVS